MYEGNGVQRGIVFTKPQYKWIKERAKELGVSVSEIVRRIVDDVRSK